MTQKITERSMLRILLHGYIWSEVIQNWSRVKDMIAEYWKQNFNWAGLMQLLSSDQ